jgi:Ca2+-binding RTX toxin-like protein
VIFGLGGNDRISGHQGDDRIDGGSGNDTIGGGQGHDKMIGGSGKDTFIFRHFGASDTDTITDFKHGTDKLAFDHATFDALDAGSLASSAFHVGTKAHDGDDHFIYDKKSGKVYYDDDGIGPHGQHLIATLTNHPILSAADFLLL